MFKYKRDNVFVVLAGIFITNAIVAELIGGKLIQLFGCTFSLGILPWPIVFITTDLINEYFGHKGVRRLTFITAGLICYAFIVLLIGIRIPSVSFSPVNDAQFTAVFGQSMWIIVGSIIAFVLSQLLDVYLFSQFKKRTGGKHIWLRATGSTLFSQLIDTFVVLGIAFYLPGKINVDQYATMGITGYSAKLVIAILLTPFIYLGHALISRYLKREEVVLPDN
ncbi:MAG: queuosine precursor transporter [Crocinitomicaceae bacterium]|nr:queuosine precursor transporter [Crocinitomicaceae bacterium]